MPARTNDAVASRAQRNERAILDAAVQQLCDEGWAGLAPARVAALAGLSITPVRNRYVDRNGIAAAAWAARCSPVLRNAMAQLIAAIDTSDRPDPRVLQTRLAQAMRPFLKPDVTMRAAIELLIVSAWEPEVAVAVRRSLDADASGWFTASAGTSPTTAAQRASMVGMALAFAAWPTGAISGRLDLERQFEAFATALLHPSRPAKLPLKGFEHFDRGFVFDTGDATLETLLRETLETVAEAGFDGATTERIARRCGYSQTVIFSRYRNKHELFVDATRRTTMVAAAINAETLARMAEAHSPGIAEAAYIREAMHPGRRDFRIVLMEQMRLGMHDATVANAFDASLRMVHADVASQLPGATPAQVRGYVHVEFARGQGPALLTVLAPTAWNLPHDVFTVPLQQAYAELKY